MLLLDATAQVILIDQSETTKDVPFKKGGFSTDGKLKWANQNVIRLQVEIEQ